MSRIGKMPVAIPAGVTVSVADGAVYVEGPKGKLNCSFGTNVDIVVKDSQVLVSAKGESKEANSFHGLYRQLVNNMIIGVSKGYTRNLQINGVGFRAEIKEGLLVLNLGYSEPIEVVLPKGITAVCENPNKITISGIDKQLVGQICAEIRSLRAPEPYKGKGIKYEEEVIRRKAGKSAAAKK